MSILGWAAVAIVVYYGITLMLVIGICTLAKRADEAIERHRREGMTAR